MTVLYTRALCLMDIPMDNLYFQVIWRWETANVGQLIPAGDYNDILSKIETKKIYQSKKFDKPAVHNLKSMIKSHKLIDIWRQKKNKTKTQFIWNRKDKSEATRIDYFLVSTEIFMNSYSSDIRPIALLCWNLPTIIVYL